MTSLNIIRKLGERKAVSVKVTYPTGYNLAAATIRFWLDAPDGTARVSGATGTATDVTPVSATAQTVWKLSYTFDADDLVGTGSYKGEFEVDFGGEMKEYYPAGKDYIKVSVVEHPASTA